VYKIFFSVRFNELFERRKNRRANNIPLVSMSSWWFERERIFERKISTKRNHVIVPYALKTCRYPLSTYIFINILIRSSGINVCYTLRRTSKPKKVLVIFRREISRFRINCRAQTISNTLATLQQSLIWYRAAYQVFQSLNYDSQWLPRTCATYLPYLQYDIIIVLRFIVLTTFGISYTFSNK
jgi:hypothetical protein